MDMTPLENWISERTGISGRPDLPRVQEYQLCKLQETLRYVITKSRFYREHLRGISPDSIQSMDDISLLPFTYPEDISSRGTDFLCVSPREIGRIVTLSTSGTTGSPKRIFFTDEDQERTIDFFHHGMTTFTDTSDRVMIFMPGSTEGSVGDLLSKGLARFNCASVVYGPIKDYADALYALIDEKITVLVGIPSQILTLSRYNGEETRAQRLKIKSVLLSADYVPRAAASTISEAWGAKVYSHYGMTETGLGGGVECLARNGYHMRDADLLFEIVDPISGLPVKDGEYGEIVVSTLTRRGMPLIRYRTGDRSRFLTQSCPCGTVLRRLDHVSGRIKEAITLSGGQRLSITQLDEIILSDKAVASYAAEIVNQNGCDCLSITIRPANKDFQAQRLRQNLQAFFESYLKQGHMALDIQCGDIGFFTTGTSKRYIADKRN